MMRRALVATALSLLPLGAAAQQQPRQQQQMKPGLLMLEHVGNSNTAAFILHVYAMQTTVGGGWGADKLGLVVVGPQSLVGIAVGPQSGPCTYDLRIVFNNGTSSEYRNVNTCAAGIHLRVDGGPYQR